MKIRALSLMILLALLVTLSACTSKEDVAAVKEAKDSLIVTDKSNVKGDFTLPSKGKNDVKITWKSTNEDVAVISDEADENGNYTVTVTRPAVGEGNAVFELVATLKLNKVKETKKFDIRVIEAAPIVGGTVAGLLALEKGTEAVLNDGIVVGIISGGYYVADSTGGIYIYGSAPEELQVGDKVNLAGTYDIYSGQPELTDISSLEIVSSGNDLPTPVETTITDIVAYDTTVKENFGKYVRIKGIVKIEGDYDNAYLYEGDKKVAVYYNSNQDAVKAFEGKKVILNAVIHTYHGGDKEWRISFVGADTDVAEYQMTAQEKLDAAKDALTLPKATIADLTLPVKDSTEEVTIAWSSANTAVIANDGKITRPATGNVEVELTATLSIDGVDADAIKKIKVNVLETAITIIDTVIDTDDNEGNWYTIKGTVFGVQENGYFIFDEDTLASDGKTVYAQEIFVSDSETNVVNGDLIQVTGQFDIKNDQPIITNIIDTTFDFSINDSVYVSTKTLSTVATKDETYLKNYGNVYRVSGFVKLEGEYDDVYIYDIASGQKLEVYYKSMADAVAAYEGKFVTLDVVAYSFEGDHWRVSVVNNNIKLDTYKTNAELFTAAQNYLDAVLPAEAAADFTLPTTDITGKVTITWATSNADVIAADGTVTNPTTADTNVTLTATLAIPSETNQTKAIVVKALAPTNVATALAKSDGTAVAIKGIVSGINGTYGYFIQDADGTAIYVREAHDVEIGDEVMVVGVLETNTGYSNNQRRLGYDSILIEVTSSDNDVFVITTDVTAANIAANIGTYSSKLIKLTNVSIEIDSYGTVFITTGETMKLKFNPDDFNIDITGWQTGDTISEITFNVYDVHYSNVRLVNVTLTK